MLWHEKKWLELDRLDRSTPVIIPLGSCEQHGHHLPLFVDTIQVTEIAQRVEKEMGSRVLLLPTLWLGSSHHHKDFPGTVSVLPSLYAEVIQQIARSVLDAGFNRLFFLNGHGGNRAPAAEALTELVAKDDSADNAYLALASWWEIGGKAMRPQGLDFQQATMEHACEYETSLMLVLRPDLVDLAKARSRTPALANEWFHSEGGSHERVSVFRRFHRFTSDGALGRSQSASADKGQAIFDGVVEQMIEFIDSFSRWPELPAIGPHGPE